jgi:hypothetical protein
LRMSAMRTRGRGSLSPRCCRSDFSEAAIGRRADRSLWSARNLCDQEKALLRDQRKTASAKAGLRCQHQRYGTSIGVCDVGIKDVVAIRYNPGWGNQTGKTSSLS